MTCNIKMYVAIMKICIWGWHTIRLLLMSSASPPSPIFLRQSIRNLYVQFDPPASIHLLKISIVTSRHSLFLSFSMVDTICPLQSSRRRRLNSVLLCAAILSMIRSDTPSLFISTSANIVGLSSADGVIIIVNKKIHVQSWHVQMYS